MSILYENSHIKIEIETSEIPWIKIFTQEPFKEMSEVPSEIKFQIYELLDLIELQMLEYFEPTKINIASFGNYAPHVHWHIMARFEEDSYYPEPMWGKKQREGNLTLPPLDIFYKNLTRIIGINDYE